MASKEERDNLTDPDGKSKAYQAKVPSVSRRISASIKEATQYTSKAVSAILGDLKYNSVFATKAEVYDWLKSVPNMDAVNALLEQANGMKNEVKKAKLLRRIYAGAKAHRMTRLEALNEALKINKDLIVEGVKKNVTPTMKMVAKDAYSRQTFTLQKQVGVGWSIDEPPAGQIVSGMNSKLEKMAEWYHGDIDTQIRDKVVTGLLEGKSTRDISKDIESLDVPPARAKAVARTMLTTVSNEAERESLKKTRIKRYEYVATLDERTCPVCGKMDGKTFPLDKAKAGVNFPPMHPNCRCVHIAALSMEIKDELTRSARGKDGKTTEVPASMTYEEWVKKFGSEKAKAKVAKVPEPDTFPDEGRFKPIEVKEPEPEPPKVEVAEEPARVVYYTTGSKKVTTPEEIEALKKETYNFNQEEFEFGEGEIGRKNRESKSRELLDNLKSIPTLMESEPVSDEFRKAWLNDKGTEGYTKEFTKHWEKYMKNLPSEQRDSIEKHTGVLYTTLNRPMFNEKNLTFNEIIDDEGEDLSVNPKRYMNSMKHYENIDTAMENAELENPIYVKRGMTRNPFVGNLEEAEVGKVYTVPNYFSTSIGNAAFDGEYQLHILIPKGKGAGVYVESISHYANEKEFIIKRNAGYLIHKIEIDDQKRKHYYVELVG